MKSRRTLFLAAYLCYTAAVWTSSLGASDEGSGDAEPAPPPKFHVVGYLPEYRMASVDPDVAKSLTDLVYFSVKVDRSGELDLRQVKDKDIAALQKIKERHAVSLHLCVGGWERSKGFGPMAASPLSRARFVKELKQFCLEKHFDGVDLDWEHPADEKQQQNYGILLAELKRAFEQHRLQLTIAVAGWQVLTPEAIRAVDRIHLMAYDAQGRHSTFEFAQADVQRLLKQGVPPSKICLGVPFYGRKVQNADMSLTYAEIMNKYQPAPEVDEVDGFYFNGAATIQRKTNFARESKLAGVMIWELGQDAKGEQSLLQAIGKARAAENGAIQRFQEK